MPIASGTIVIVVKLNTSAIKSKEKTPTKSKPDFFGKK